MRPASALRNFAAFSICLSLFLPSTSWAVDVLSGTFDGSEPKIDPLPAGCGSIFQLPYQQVGFQVSVSGQYVIVDVNNFNQRDITINVYQGSFNPGNPAANFVEDVDRADSAQLNSGVDYVLVVQNWCEPGEGAWAVTLAGPGTVTSSSTTSVPAFTSGTFTSGDPITDSDCGNSQYLESGPIQLSRTGVYFYRDISLHHAVDMCLQIYSAPFNPQNPDANRVARWDDFGSELLQANTDYYFVAQPLSDAQNGEFFYLFMPPADFRINAEFAGSWFNPDTGGQGFFLDVFDEINRIFLAWFTYDLSRPDASVMAEIGDPGHRWLTAFGPFDAGSANLSIEWTEGGVFDSGTPDPTQTTDGTILLEFSDCTAGSITYDLGSTGAAGVVPIRRLANDNVDRCRNLLQEPAEPGPL